MKRASLIVSIILCLTLLLSMGATGVFATEEGQETAFVKNRSMTLNDEIVVKFQMDFTPEILADTGAKVEVTVGSRTYTAAVSKDLVVSVPVYATQMTEAITVATIGSNGASVASRSFTVREYLQEIRGNDIYSSYHKLAKELLNYGSAAQLHFAVNTGDLAGAGIQDAGQSAVPSSATQYTIEDQSDALDCKGASLVYRDKIALRFYFTEDQEYSKEGLGGCTFTVNGKAVPVTVNETDGYVEVPGVLPQDLDKQVVLSVTDEDDHVISVTYSPMTYIVRMSQKGTDTTKALVKALYNYHLAAKAFVPLPEAVISFNVGHDGESFADRTIVVGGTYGELPEPTREGYTFEGWYTDADYTGTAVTADTTVSASHTLYAKWTKNVVEYDISFNLNYEGAPAGPATIQVAEGAAYGELPTPTRAQTRTTTSGGYTFYYGFAGWYTNAECTGEVVKPTDVVTEARPLYAKWEKAILMPRATNSVYSDPTLQYIEGEWVYVYANNGTARTSAEQERLNLHLPEEIAYAVSYKVMLTNETDAALFYTDSGNLGVDVYDPDGNLLYSRNYKNGGTTTQVTLEEGKWYTIVHSNRDSSTYYLTGINYFGIGVYGDGAGGATMYVKDIEIATENAPSTAAVDVYTNNVNLYPNRNLRVIDGEWAWVFAGNQTQTTMTQRFLKFDIKTGPLAKITFKMMMDNCTGSVTPSYNQSGSGWVNIKDANGNEVSRSAVQPGVWYDCEFVTNGSLNVNQWGIGYFGSGTGGIDVYFKDIEVHYPEEETGYDVTFDLNYDGALAAPEAIKIEEGAAYGTLPSPTLEQTRSVKRASDNKLMYYSFAGWYLDAECTGEPVKPTDVVDQSRTLYAKWDNVSFLPRGTGYQNPTFQYVEGEWVTVLKSSGTGNDAENKRLNVFLPESPVYGVASKVMVKNDSDAAITYTHNGNNACFIYDSNWKLVFSAVIGGSANATLQLNEGEWYTFVYAQATSDGNYNNNMAGTDGNYWGLGGFNDANNDVTIYIKDAQIQPEKMEPIAGTEVGAGYLAAPAHVYVDGQWMYLSTTSGEENSEYKRYFKVVTLDKTATQFSVKVKMTNFTGSAVPGYGPTGSLTAKIYDPDGNEVSASALKADVWYTFVHSKNGEVLSSDWYHLGGFGKGKGGLDIYFKDVVFSSPQYYDVTFNLNYDGAPAAPEAIKIEEGAAYGILPTPTRAQTRTTTSGSYTFYYGFAGWYTNAECTGEAVKPSDIADASRTLYAKWVKASLMPRATNSVYSDPTLQYIEGEWVYVYANNGTAKTSAEQERMNVHLPEKVAYAVSYKVMLKNNTDAALTYTDSGNLGIDIYNAEGERLYNRNYQNGGTSTQITLEEGEWYTVVHAARDSSSYNQVGLDYYGLGVYGDGEGGATMYVKDIEIATENAPSTAAVDVYTNDVSLYPNRNLRVIDGEWAWVFAGNQAQTTQSGRFLRFNIKTGPVSKVTFKLMADNCTGDVVFNYAQVGSAAVTFKDPEGNTVDWDKLQTGVWYDCVFTRATAMTAASDWSIGYFGTGTGGMDIYFKDIQLVPAE